MWTHTAHSKYRHFKTFRKRNCCLSLSTRKTTTSLLCPHWIIASSFVWYFQSHTYPAPCCDGPLLSSNEHSWRQIWGSSVCEKLKIEATNKDHMKGREKGWTGIGKSWDGLSNRKDSRTDGKQFTTQTALGQKEVERSSYWVKLTILINLFCKSSCEDVKFNSEPHLAFYTQLQVTHGTFGVFQLPKPT